MFLSGDADGTRAPVRVPIHAMMSSNMPTPEPTPRELEILEVLWHRGEATVREIYEELGDDLPIVHTTVQTFLRSMTKKGMVSYRESGRSYVYRALVKPEPTRLGLLNQVLNRVYGGAIDQLVEGAVRLKPPSDQELARLRKLMDELDGGSPPEGGAR